MRSIHTTWGSKARAVRALWAAALSGAWVMAHAAGPYEVTFLHPGAGFDAAAGVAIQANGDVVGYLSRTEGGGTATLQAVIWRGGVATVIGPGVAMDVNAAGLVAGNIRETQAWTWSGGTPALLPTLGGTQASAYGVNDAGTVVGRSSTVDGQLRPTRWDGGSATALPGTGGGSAMDINASGQIVGWAAFADPVLRPAIWNGQQVTALPTLGGDSGIAMAINDQGMVVGNSNREAGGARHATLWVGNQAIALGTRGFSSEAYGINNQGQVVGGNLTGLGQGGRQFGVLWEDGEIFELNDFLGSYRSEWSVSLANDINDAGQIIGSAFGTGGRRSVVVFSPVPEPAVAWMLLAGLAGLAGVMLRNRGR